MEPSEERFIMYRKSYEDGRTDAELSQRHVNGSEFSRLNGGQGIRFATHNGENGSGKVLIVNPNKPKEYFQGQNYPPQVLKD